MTTGHVYIATSLDGFVAREDNNLDWLMKQPQPDVDEDGGYNSFFSGMDGLVMGSGSFRTVASFGDWPYTKPVVVMSQTMTDADIRDDLKDKVRITRKDPAALMEELEAEGWARAYIDGGQVIQSFLRAGLIEDLILTQIPILLGRGKPLFGPLDQDVDLELLRSLTLSSGLLQVHYRVKS